MYHGILNVCKEAGFTSHDVVAKLRGICKQKKIGHTGTLDPDAVGVLPVCLGSGTGLCDILTDKDKEYIARFRLGITTDTQDIWGTILTEQLIDITPEQIKETIHKYIGAYDQIPPMYSAIKINGKRLYELAREGKVVKRKARQVHISHIEILSIQLPEIEIKVNCSKGTYIRTLCHDIGQSLGCGGAMTALQRTRVGKFSIEDAFTLLQLQELAHRGELETVLIPVEAIFAELPEIVVKEQFHKLLINGNRIYHNQTGAAEILEEGSRVRVYSYEHRFYGIYAYRKAENLFFPIKMFMTDR